MIEPGAGKIDATLLTSINVLAELSRRATGLGGAAQSIDSASWHNTLAWFQARWPKLLDHINKLREIGDDQQAAECIAAMMHYLRVTADWPSLSRLAEIGVAAATRSGDQPLRIELMNAQGVALALQGDDTASAVLQEVVALAGAQRDHGGEAVALAHLGQIHRNHGDLDQAAAALRRAQLAYELSGHPLGQARALGDLVRVLDELGDAEGSADCARRSAELFDAAGDRLGMAAALRRYAANRAQNGEPDEAIDVLGTVVAVFAEFGCTADHIEALLTRARIRRSIRDLAGALTDAEDAARYAVNDPDQAKEVAQAVQVFRSERAVDALLAAPTASAWSAVVREQPAASGPFTFQIFVNRLEDADDDAERITAVLMFLFGLPDSAPAQFFEAEWTKIQSLAAADRVDAPAGLAEATRTLMILPRGRWPEILRAVLADLPADRFPSLRGYHLLDLAQALQGDPRRLEEVIDLLRQAITLLDHPVAAEIRATALVSLGSAYRSRSSSSGADETEHALVAFRSALATFRRRSYPQQWASTMVNLANTYWERRSQDRLRNLRRAIARHTAALTVFTRDEDPTAWARTMANLGLAQSDPALVQDSDMLETARRNLHGALEVAGLPDDLTAAAWTNLNLCYSRRLTGDPDENAEAALRCARQAYELYRGLGSSLDMAEAAAAVGAALGNRAVREGRPDLDEPVRWYEHALALVSRRDTPLKWAYLADNLATSLAQRGRDDLDDLGRAVDLHRAALLAYEDVDDSYEQARTRYNLAATLLRRADSNLAEIVRLFEHSLRDRPVDAVPLEWAESATELARVRLAVAQSDPVAIALLERVVDVVSPLAAHDHARRAWSLLGAAFADSSRWPDAARAYREALAAAERLYLLARLPDGKDAELVQAADIPRLAAYATARAADPTGAAAILERNRARSLGERLDRDSVRLTDLGVVPEYAARGYTAAVARIRTLEATLRQQGVSRTASGTRQLRAAMIDAQVQRDAAVAAIRGQHGFEDFLAVPIEAILARACAGGTPLAYLVITPHGSVALLARGESEPVTVEAIFSSPTETDLLAALGSRDGEPEYPENTRALVEVLDVLGRGVVGAVATRLRELEARAAVLVPTGLLGILPLHAARYSVADRTVYFQDEFDLSYAPSARVLSAARTRIGTTTAQTIGRFVGVAEPVPSDPPLPWATAEVEAIRSLVDGQVDVLAGPSATVTELRRSLPGTTHLHLACHATYNVDEPLASSVFLADGTQLTLRDLLDEQLLAGVRLVVASACETAVTDTARLPDEVIGLAAGLVESGAAIVVGSLWSVGDRSTALIMARFYRNQLQGDPATGEPPMPPARALARAQAWLRDATRQEIRAFAAAAGLSRFTPEVTRRPGTSNLPGLTPYAGSPFHWAPFIMIGA